MTWSDFLEVEGGHLDLWAFVFCCNLCLWELLTSASSDETVCRSPFNADGRILPLLLRPLIQQVELPVFLREAEQFIAGNHRIL